MIHRRRNGEIGEAEFAPGLQNRVALGKILSARANVSPGGDVESGADFALAEKLGIFLNENGIRTRWHRCAGKDTHGLAFTHRARESVACGSLAYDGED
ncbi:hypothetical protein D3C87_1863960 [compost metagenome]